MKRTTLAIDEDLLRELKRRAADRGTSFQAVANELLRKALAPAAPPRTRFKLRLPPAWAAELEPGVDIADRDRLLDLLDGRT